MSLEPLFVDVGTTLENTGGFLQYVLVFVFAAIPLLEILVVIPVGIGLGLDPVATGALAFAGNVASVYVLIYFHRRISNWRRDRRSADETDSSNRFERARGLWERYGLPGIAIGGPILTGVHIAALVALLAGSSERTVAGWMTVGIGLWTALLVVGSVFGVSLLGVA
ncbi:small multi-drug export protein [Natronorubrum halophilum]|uniref:small multi-drug export protein n=1 Tax=Natronorubrum halophilum TaxID=1702106 RepID=UPI0010C21683|nr:small multi-drug export protein [Natronorubrum halophilum]